MKKIACLSLLVALALSACCRGEKKKEAARPKNAAEAFAATSLAKKQKECKASGVIVDSVVNPKACDSFPLATWKCTEAALRNRLTAAGVEDLEKFLTEVHQYVAKGFDLEQCGERKAAAMTAGKLTSIKVILIQKEFDGTKFSGLAQRFVVDLPID